MSDTSSDTRRSIRARAPNASSANVRNVMRANVGRTTSPELKLRRAFFAAGLRYRKNRRPEPGYRCTADLIFLGPKVCVFLDGCFWHGCPQHFVLPNSNKAWWSEKIADNRARDTRQTEYLVARGWLVIRVWEHDDLDKVAERVKETVMARGRKI
jgi:DNA mismatch endonuclease (patch repair protein)